VTSIVTGGDFPENIFRPDKQFETSQLGVGLPFPPVSRVWRVQRKEPQHQLSLLGGVLPALRLFCDETGPKKGFLRIPSDIFKKRFLTDQKLLLPLLWEFTPSHRMRNRQSADFL